MKKSHKDILNKIEAYLSQPGAEHLRFWQAMYNINLVVENNRFDEKGEIVLPITIKDDHNISDECLLKRISENITEQPIKDKITVWVAYEEWQDAGHALLDDYKIKRTKIVQVEDVMELNQMFKHITKIKILT